MLFSRLLHILGLCVALGSSASASPQETEPAPWTGVGHLALDGSRYCVGTLVDRDLVLTAAHCLYDPESGDRLATERLTFRIGRDDTSAPVGLAFDHPDYDYHSSEDLVRAQFDMALLRLSRPLQMEGFDLFDIAGSAQAGDALYLITQGDADTLSTRAKEQSCNVMDRKDAVYVLSCAVDFGVSGAPALAVRSGEARIVTLVSAKAVANGHPASLGPALERNLEVLKRAMSRKERGDAILVETNP